MVAASTLGVLAATLVSGCVRPVAVNRAATAPETSVPRIAIMSAFDAEWQALRSATQITGTQVVNNRTFYFGRLAGHDVVLLLSGFSMVNAAMTTQALLDRVPVKAIVFSGIAGGVNPGLNVGDVTVPAQWGNYQEQLFARETPQGFAPSRVTTDFGGYGMMFPQGTSVTVRNAPPDSLERRFWFPVDSLSLAVARTVAGQATLKRCIAADRCLDHTPKLVVGGNGVSGPTFVDNAAYREWVWKTFQADALDMESSAVALVAYENQVPFIAFRSLSDLAGGNEAPNEARIFGRLASENSAAVVMAFLTALPASAFGAESRQ
ncbi:5'-methylthioadenosine/S-adenosylhomocysteine nucleosidase [Gemmatimonas sp.]